MKNLKKENEALKSYIETLKNDREILMSQIKKYELQLKKLEPDFDKETLLFLQNQFKNLLDLDISDEKIENIYNIIILDFLAANGTKITLKQF